MVWMETTDGTVYLGVMVYLEFKVKREREETPLSDQPDLRVPRERMVGMEYQGPKDPRVYKEFRDLQDPRAQPQQPSWKLKVLETWSLDHRDRLDLKAYLDLQVRRVTWDPWDLLDPREIMV